MKIAYLTNPFLLVSLSDILNLFIALLTHKLLDYGTKLDKPTGKLNILMRLSFLCFAYICPIAHVFMPNGVQRRDSVYGCR